MKKLILTALLLAMTVDSTAEIVAERVPYEHAGVLLEGVLFYDDAKVGVEPLPGVLVIHEWWGQNGFSRNRARALAKLGYVAFALDMYGKGVSTRDAAVARELAGQFYGKPLMAERAQAGLDQLLASKYVDPQRVAAIGYSFGGSTAMTLAYSGAPLVGMVSFYGGPMAASPEAVARNQAKFLICHGAADPLVSKEQLDRFLRSLDEGEVDYQFIAYQGAQHAFANREADKLADLNQITGIRYDARAAKRSWEHMQSFFEEIFR